MKIHKKEIVVKVDVAVDGKEFGLKHCINRYNFKTPCVLDDPIKISVSKLLEIILNGKEVKKSIKKFWQ